MILIPRPRNAFNDLISIPEMNESSNEQLLPDLHSIKSDVQYLRHLRKRLRGVVHRISQAVKAIPVLEKEVQEEEQSRRASPAAFDTLLSTLDRSSALTAIGPQNQFIQSQLPLPTAGSGTSYTFAGFIGYHSTIPEKNDSLRKSLETARREVDTAVAQQKRLQNAINTTAKAIKAKYELVHPIHRLSRLLLIRIFALVVSEEYTAADYRSNIGRKVRPLVTLTSLSSVCHHWRDIVYAAGSLWNRILITTLAPPTPFRTTQTEQPAFVLVVEGQRGDGGSPIARQIQSLASQTAVHDLAYSGGALESVRECLIILPNLRRLSLTCTKAKSDPLIISLPSTLDKLTDLSCFDAYPSFTSTIASLESLGISVCSGGTEKPPPLDCLLAMAPNLKSLLLARTPYLEVGSDIRHCSITSIKAHPSAFIPLANALREGRLSLPNLSSLELLDTSLEGILLKWEEMFAEGSWTSQITNLRLNSLRRAASSATQDKAHQIFAPFSSLTFLSIAREDRPELLLSASQRELISKLTHIKVEKSACDGVALLKEVKEYNARQVLSGEVSRLTHVELLDCPNVAVGVMKQLRLFREVERAVFRQVRKHEELPPPSAVLRLPPSPPTPQPRVAREDLPQDSQLVGAGGRALEMPVQEDLPAYSESAPPPPALLQLETPIPQDQGVVVAAELEKPKAKELPLTLLQRRQSGRPQTPIRRQRLCL